MAEGQQVEFVVEVLHTEQQLAVLGRPLPEGGGEVVEGIVHPAHVPLVVKLVIPSMLRRFNELS